MFVEGLGTQKLGFKYLNCKLEIFNYYFLLGLNITLRLGFYQIKTIKSIFKRC